ncbi:MAG: glycine cleavage system protein GcvH [Propionibacteriaceae bacterium]|nr:glycine cleavage system protein GcvH [Propionibacteriaceae bacterium]
MAEIPQDLKYTRDHEWVQPLSPTTVRVGVTAHAAEHLGDVVFVSLPAVGARLGAGDACAELESTKSVSDVYAPLAGVISAVNDAVAEAPEAINAEPYGDGWLFEMELSAAAAADELLDAAKYQSLLDD